METIIQRLLKLKKLNKLKKFLVNAYPSIEKQSNKD